MTLPVQDDRTEEPVRLGGYSALGAGLALQAIILFSAGAPPLAVAGAIAALALAAIPGLEWVRAHATPWPLSPKQVEKAIDNLPQPRHPSDPPYLSYEKRTRRPYDAESDVPSGPEERPPS